MPHASIAPGGSAQIVRMAVRPWVLQTDGYDDLPTFARVDRRFHSPIRVYNRATSDRRKTYPENGRQPFDRQTRYSWAGQDLFGCSTKTEEQRNRNDERGLHDAQTERPRRSAAGCGMWRHAVAGRARFGTFANADTPWCAKTRAARLRGVPIIELEQAAEPLTALDRT